MMVTALFARMRSLWRGLRHRADVEAEMRQEFLHHVELRTQDLIRRGCRARRPLAKLASSSDVAVILLVFGLLAALGPALR